MSFLFCKNNSCKNNGFKNSARLLIAGASLSLLTACSWFSGDDNGVDDARLLAPLEIPPDLVSPVGDPALVRPKLAATNPATVEQVKAASCQCEQPPRIGERVLPAGKGVQRMREGQRRWLSVEAEPEQAWPLVRKFLTKRGYRVARDEPAIGLLETDWKAQYGDGKYGDEKPNSAPALWRERLRIRIEPAEQAGRSDLFLAQRNGQRSADGGPWQLRPADEDRAVEMLNRLARYLAGNNVSDALPLKPLDAKIAVDDNNSTVIIVAATFDLVWRRTNLALDSLGFSIEDRDRSNRIFHVYNDLPSGLTAEELKYGKKRSATVREEYWIHVQENGEATHLSVRDKAGKVDESSVAKHLLTLLLGKLK